MRYRFEDVEVDGLAFEVHRGGELVAVEPRVFDLLLLLVANPNRLVAKAEILDVVWGDRFVSDAAMTTAVKSARKAIGDSGREQRFIQTVHGRGYRFVGDVTAQNEDRTDAGTSGPSEGQIVDPIDGRPSVDSSDSGFVGRIEQVAQVVGANAEGSPYTTVLIGGEAGIGKSRLVQEVGEELRALGHVVAIGECLDVGAGSLPFVPIVAALRDAASQFAPTEVTDAITISPELTMLLPDYGDQAVRPAMGSLDGSSALQLFAAVSGMLSRLSSSRPICLVIEDLHWVDPSSRDLFGFLARSLVGSPVTLVATYRNDELSDGHPLRGFVAELMRSPRVVDVALDPFDRAELAALATTVLGHEPDDAEMAELAERSGGNPFYASEVLAALPGNHTVRPGLADLIRSRVDSLSDTTRQLLRIASLAGRSVDDDLLQAVSAVGEADLVRGLREAAIRQIVRLSDDGTVQFRHALIQEAVYTDLVPRERTQIHRRFAEAIAAAGDQSAADSNALRAWHHRKAGQLAEALQASIAAARSAAAILATQEALDHVATALELWPSVPGAATLAGIDRVDLLEWTAQLADAAGEYFLAADRQRTAVEELADKPVDRLARASTQLARYLWTAGQVDDALVEYERAVAMVSADPATPARSAVLAGYGQQLMLASRHREAAVVLEEAIEVARRTDDRMTEGHAKNSLGTAVLNQGRRDAGVALLRGALAIATEESNHSERVRAYINLSSGLSEVGDLPAARGVAEEGLAVAAEVGYSTGLGFFLAGNLVKILNDMGRWDEADAVTESLAVPKGARARAWLQRLGIDRLLGRGQTEEADELISVGDFTDEAGHWTREARVAMALGDVPRARHAVATGLRLQGNLHHELTFRALSIELLARESASDATQPAATAEIRAEVEALQRRFRAAVPSDDSTSYRLEALVAEAEGWLLLAEGENPSEPWCRAIALWDAGAMRWPRAKALVRLAAASVKHDPGQARQVLTEGRELAEELGAKQLIDQATEIQDRLEQTN